MIKNVFTKFFVFVFFIIGCGDGKHLQDKCGVFSVGAERSSLQASLARERCQEVLLGENLRLPFRSNAFDAALSIEVLHHFTTKQRRIEALKEISRILKIGGRALITVQRHNNKVTKNVFYKIKDMFDYFLCIFGPSSVHY